MENWGEVSRVVVTSPLSDGEISSITSLKFDNQQNLLWCGDSKGVTRSFTPQSSTIASPFSLLQLSQYTKFKSSLGHTPVKQYLNHQRGILSLLENCINLNNRKGLSQLSITRDSTKLANFDNFSSFTFKLGSTNDIIVGGQNLFELDLQKPNVVLKIGHDGNVSFLNSSLKVLVLGLSKGEIELFDTQSNQCVKSFYGHNGLLSDMDVQGNYIASCGHSLRPRRNINSQPSYVIDPLVNIYDLRMMRPLAPIPFPAGASFVRFHPKLPNVIVIASSMGQLQFVDIYDQLTVYLHQADLGDGNMTAAHMTKNHLSNLEISTNGEFISFSDSANDLHVWSLKNNTEANFTTFPSMLEQPDSINPFSQENIEVDDLVPLSTIGMPYFKELLLSNYAPDLHFTKELLKVPPCIDVDLLKNIGTSRYLPYDESKFGKKGTWKAHYSLKEGKKQRHILMPKFISERTGNEFTSEKFDIFDFTSNESSIPNCYTNLRIQYSKFGVEDFDFSYYNKTRFSGLENHLDNSYINSLLQLYKYSLTFQNFISSTLLKEWLPVDLETMIVKKNPLGSSILNELGYLFDMMSKSSGKNCRITNLSHLLNNHCDAARQDLLDVEDGKGFNSFELRAKIIKFNQFLLETCNKDLGEQFGKSLAQLMGTDCHEKSNSVDYNSNHVRERVQLYLTICKEHIPEVNSMGRGTNWTIVDSLNYLALQGGTFDHRGYNNIRFHTNGIGTDTTSLPQILLININLSNNDYRAIRAAQRWLVPSLYAVRAGEKTHFNLSNLGQNSQEYELLGYVCEINHVSDLAKGGHNLVSFVKIENDWYLFNDFLVTPISESEVFNLSYQWKKPVICLYSRINALKFEKFELNSFADLNGLDDTILYRDHFAHGARVALKKEYELLTREEAPGWGTLVAIDAEFVVLEPEELEVLADGSKTLIKPRKLSLARVSALRGDNGKGQGVAFIDDYIVHTGTIDDYLTNYSGIMPGDLHPDTSEKTLTTLQTAYRKLWLLLNLGCVFVGHGLQNDFRCINLHVPKNQIRDTAELFYLPELKRKLSLKFLAYILLKEKVQTGNHDSIEDAYTALLLYKKYLELKAIGEFESSLQNIYLEGQQLRFKAPDF